MRQRKPSDSARHADRESAVARFLRVGVAFVVEKDIARGRGRRALTIVDGDIFIAGGEMDDHETAAAEIAGLRHCRGKRKSDRDRSVDRVAAARENVDADPRRECILARHHAVARCRGLGLGDARTGRGVDNRGLRRRG